MRLISTLVVAALIAGCGFKGPLYLPQDKPAPSKPPAAKPAAKPAVPTEPPVVPQ
jgi:predicted small lipoprotein YifL